MPWWPFSRANPSSSPSELPPPTHLQPTPTTATTTAPHPTPADIDHTRRMTYYLMLGTTLACPILAAIPPRKFDPWTFGLVAMWCTSAGWVTEYHTGRGLMWHVGSLIPSDGNRKLAERESERESERERQLKVGEVVREDAARREREREQEKGLVASVMRADEGADWVEKRRRKEVEALEEGRGYSGLIGDYILEAFGAKEEDEEEGDENDGDNGGEGER